MARSTVGLTTENGPRGTRERWERIGRLYGSALERKPEDREAYLARACQGDADLRQELSALLAAEEEANGFLGAPALEVTARSLAIESVDSWVGRSMGRYTVLSHIGAGGMGEVYLAWDSRLDRKVALKVAPRLFVRDLACLRRYEEEARAASALNHPNVVTVFDVDEVEGVPFIALELVEGRTLRQILSSGPLALETVLDLTIQIASALSAAHARGVVHRDIKPENVMVREDGLVKVLDFGLANRSGSSRATTAGLDGTHAGGSDQDLGGLFGTIGYAAPEQIRGEKVDERADLFSLGVLLYEMLAGRAPFVGRTLRDVIDRTLDRETTPVFTFAGKVPAKLVRIVRKALEKAVEDRYQEADELLRDLASVKAELRLGAGTHREAASVTTRRRKSPLRRITAA